MRSSSSASVRFRPAGSKIVREERELLADRRKALRRRLGRGGTGHTSTVARGVAGALGARLRAAPRLGGLDLRARALGLGALLAAVEAARLDVAPGELRRLGDGRRDRHRG